MKKSNAHHRYEADPSLISTKEERNWRAHVRQCCQASRSPLIASELRKKGSYFEKMWRGESSAMTVTLPFGGSDVPLFNETISVEWFGQQTCAPGAAPSWLCAFRHPWRGLADRILSKQKQAYKRGTDSLKLGAHQIGYEFAGSRKPVKLGVNLFNQVVQEVMWVYFLAEADIAEDAIELGVELLAAIGPVAAKGGGREKTRL